ncbi:MAG: hypothetical protein ABIN97_07165, partial [Ginsengibacter sp.]
MILASIYKNTVFIILISHIQSERLLFRSSVQDIGICVLREQANIVDKLFIYITVKAAIKIKIIFLGNERQKKLTPMENLTQAMKH